VFIGRPFNYAATVAGADGVAHAVNILMREIDCDLGLLGINRIADLGPQHLLRRGEVPDFGMAALPQRRAA
jgi:L-lactate dehydrogenase (cytochrome)